MAVIIQPELQSRSKSPRYPWALGTRLPELGDELWTLFCACKSFAPNSGAILKSVLCTFSLFTQILKMPAHFRAVDNAVEKVGKVREYVDNGLGVTLDVALDLEEVCKESEQVKELEDTMLQYITMDREMDQWVKAVDLAKTEFNRQYDASR